MVKRDFFPDHYLFTHPDESLKKQEEETTFNIGANLYDQSKMGLTLMKGGQPGELGENCSWPTCKEVAHMYKHIYDNIQILIEPRSPKVLV